MARRICKVHGDPLIHDRIEMRSGMPDGPPPEGQEAPELKIFPKAKSYVFVGCAVPASPFVRVYFCPTCRQAEKDWQASREVGEFWRV